VASTAAAENINSFSHALLVAAPAENDCLVTAKKPANSRQGAQPQLETASCNEILMANTVAVEPQKQVYNLFTHALLLEDG
jgi:hypothetical protein